MDCSKDKITDAQLKKVVRRAWKQVLQTIDREPILVIEANGSEAVVSGDRIAGRHRRD